MANFVKTELVEFQINNAFSENSKDPIDVKKVLLENIPKIEMKILGDESTSNEEDDPSYPYNIDTYNDSDLNSDPGIDPFADIDCDPSFSIRPRPQTSYISNGSAFTYELINPAKKFLPDASICDHNAQFKTPDSKLECGLCLETQISEDKLKIHLEICAASHKDRRRFCVPCNKLFPCNTTYGFHAFEIHGIKVVEARGFKCDVCSIAYVHEESFIAHLASNHEKNSALDGISSKLKLFKCQECPVRFKQLSYLLSHKKTHRNEREFKCPIPNCKKAFNINASLKYHLRNFHSQIKPYKCKEPNCGSAFITNEQLLKHMVCHSAQDTPLKCPHSDCNRTFKSKATFRSHLVVHTGARRYTEMTKRPFKCEECGRGFCFNSQLTKHLEGHGHTPEMFKCPQLNCNKMFKYKESIKEHVDTIHRSKDAAMFECPEPNCDKKFKTKKYMTDHFRSVHRRPYECREPDCIATFPRPHLLNSHVQLKHRNIKKD